MRYTQPMAMEFVKSVARDGIDPNRSEQILSTISPDDLNQRMRDRTQFLEAQRACSLVFSDRNLVYGDAFRHAGLLGTACALIDDMERLRQMVIKNPQHGRNLPKEVCDKLIDIANYAMLSLMLLEESNYDGPEHPLGANEGNGS